MAPLALLDTPMTVSRNGQQTKVRWRTCSHYLLGNCFLLLSHGSHIMLLFTSYVVSTNLIFILHYGSCFSHLFAIFLIICSS